MLISIMIFLYTMTIFSSYKYLSKMLYVYQSVGYNLKRFFVMYKPEKNIFLMFIVNFVQMLIGVIIYCIKLNTYFTLVSYLFIFLFSIFYLIHYVPKSELKYTPRIKRFIFIFYLFVFVGLLFVLFYIKINYIVYLILGFYNLYLILLLILTVFMMLLFEYVLSLKYILLTKTKISKTKIKYNIAITGSFGKTSVKNILYTILSKKYNICVTPKNYNTLFGICKTVKNLSNNHNLILFEYGANKKNDIKKLSKLVQPNIGCLVNIGTQHLETFKTFENIYNTKKELVDYIEKRNGDIVFNLENKFTYKMCIESSSNKIGICFYKNYEKFRNENILIYNAKVISVNENGSEFELYENEEYVDTLKTKLLGEHNILNLLFAVAVARKLNLRYSEIKVGVNKINQVQNRLQVKKLKNGGTLIDDSYNSNFISFNCALKVLDSFKDKNKIIVTPGIVELGEKQYDYNFELGKQIANICDEVVIVKEVNKEALYNGLIDKNFDRSKISFISKINYEFLKQINMLGCENVVLIENDLPNIYK